MVLLKKKKNYGVYCGLVIESVVIKLIQGT